MHILYSYGGRDEKFAHGGGGSQTYILKYPCPDP
jgi:hypothetical protein